MITAGLVVLAGTSLAMIGAWLVQRRTGEAEVVDVVWTASLGVAAVVHALLAGDFPGPRRVLVAAIAVAWSARLSAHLFRRVRAEGEDGRYAALRERWGANASRRMLLFFLAQGVSVALLSLQFGLAVRVPGPLGLADAIGALIGAIAIGGEALADRQLARWKADPAREGKVCREGLWRVSRHPNYFFEWIHWFAYTAIAWGAPHWPWTLVAPAGMYVLLRYVTGVPPAETQSLRSRGEAYAKYQREVSAFVPLPPRGGG